MSARSTWLPLLNGASIGDRSPRPSSSPRACTWRCPPATRVQPVWLVPAVLRALPAVLIIGDPGRIDRQKPWLRIVTSTVIALITLANLVAAIRLVVEILTNNKVFADHPGRLLAAGVLPFAGFLDRDRGQSHGHISDQAVGQAAHDAR